LAVYDENMYVRLRLWLGFDAVATACAFRYGLDWMWMSNVVVPESVASSGDRADDVWKVGGV
jgi:hypothetical protein